MNFTLNTIGRIFKFHHAKVKPSAPLTQAPEDLEQEAADEWQNDVPTAIAVQMGGVTIPAGAVGHNFLVTGGMGSGKTAALRSMARDVAKAGKRMLVYGNADVFERQFYRPGTDVAFNPFRKDFPGWSLINEVRDAASCTHLAANLLPMSLAGNPLAADLLAAVLATLWTQGERSNVEVLAFLESQDVEVLAAVVTATQASGGAPASAPCVDELEVVRQKLVKHLDFLRSVPDGAFSVKDFVADTQADTRLFLSGTEAQADVIMPMTAAVVQIAWLHHLTGQEGAKAAMLWTILEDMPSIPLLPKSAWIATAVGHCTGLVTCASTRHIEDFTAWDAVHGPTIAAQLKTRLFLRAHANAEVTAGFVPHRAEDSEKLISDLSSLPECCGYLCIPRCQAPAKVSIPHPTAV